MNVSPFDLPDGPETEDDIPAWLAEVESSARCDRTVGVTSLAWLDEDGYHIWFAHDCTTGREVTMLPWPTWHQGVRSDSYLEGPYMVVPSIGCRACNFHGFMNLSDRAVVCGEA